MLQHKKVVNSAVIFVKPHANTKSCVTFVENELEKEGFTIISKRSIKQEELENNIDEHYRNLSISAISLSAKDIEVSPEIKVEFYKKFNDNWDQCVKEERILNAESYMKLTGISDAMELLEEWDDKDTIKFGLFDGVTLGCFRQLVGQKSFYVLNAFYPALRSKFTQKNSEITAFVVEFNEKKITWEKFRQTLVGASNPEKAPESAIRRKILKNWRKLGLKKRPDKSENGIHASAGPVEGLRERVLWFSKESDIETDPFSSQLVESGITCEEIEDIVNDTDLMEQTKEMNTSDCVEFLKHKFVV